MTEHEPTWCAPTLCESTGSDTFHREVPALIEAADYQLVTVGLWRIEDYDGHNDEVRLVVGDAEAFLNRAQLKRLMAALADASARADWPGN